MKFTLVIDNNHLSNSYTALKFAQALINKQHIIDFIYFVADGVYVANKNIDMPTDEYNVSNEWSKFALANNLKLTVCSSSGSRRGINQNCLNDGFKMGSIGQFVESSNKTERVVKL